MLSIRARLARGRRARAAWAVTVIAAACGQVHAPVGDAAIDGPIDAAAPDAAVDAGIDATPAFVEDRSCADIKARLKAVAERPR